MKGNGGIKKYFDALNKRLDAFEKRVEEKFEAIDARFDGIDRRLDSIDKRLDGIDERLDTLTVEVGDLKLKVELLNMLTTDMQRVQQIMIKDIAEIKVRVERLEDGQKRIIILITKLAERVSDFDSGKKFELSEVRHDEASHKLTGIIREPEMQYRSKKRKRK